MAVPRIDLSEVVPKQFRAGTHRTVAPEETVARVRRFTPVMGITRVANVTGLDHIGIPVVMVCRPNSRGLSVAQGKGLDLAAAKASGLMESIESFHAERIQLPLLLAAYEELRYTHRVVDVEQLPRQVAGPYHPLLQLHWIEGYDLMQGEPVWLPYDLVHVNYTVAMHRHMAGFFATSNGLASGNHLLEALSHAICEVVERDAFRLWGLLDEGRRASTRVDLGSIDDPDCCTVLEHYARADIDAAVWEMTSDIGMPAFICRIRDRDGSSLRQLGVSEGMGCAPTRGIALLRALTEAAQSRLTQIAGSRDDCVRSSYQRNPAAHEQQMREFSAVTAGRSFADSPGWQADTFDADLERELALLRNAGVTRVIAVDLTRREFGIPVVRVVIPGLETKATHHEVIPGARARARMERTQ